MLHKVQVAEQQIVVVFAYVVALVEHLVGYAKLQPHLAELFVQKLPRCRLQPTGLSQRILQLIAQAIEHQLQELLIAHGLVPRTICCAARATTAALLELLLGRLLLQCIHRKGHPVAHHFAAEEPARIACSAAIDGVIKVLGQRAIFFGQMRQHLTRQRPNDEVVNRSANKQRRLINHEQTQSISLLSLSTHFLSDVETSVESSWNISTSRTSTSVSSLMRVLGKIACSDSSIGSCGSKESRLRVVNKMFSILILYKI